MICVCVWIFRWKISIERRNWFNCEVKFSSFFVCKTAIFDYLFKWSGWQVVVFQQNCCWNLSTVFVMRSYLLSRTHSHMSFICVNVVVYFEIECVCVFVAISAVVTHTHTHKTWPIVKMNKEFPIAMLVFKFCKLNVIRSNDEIFFLVAAATVFFRLFMAYFFKFFCEQLFGCTFQMEDNIWRYVWSSCMCAWMHWLSWWIGLFPWQHQLKWKINQTEQFQIEINFGFSNRFS